MSIESTKEYKQDRINVRKINLIIVTGRCYKYKENYYELEENNGRELKGDIFRKLEHCITINYKDILTNKKYTRIVSDFFFKFVKVEQQLL